MPISEKLQNAIQLHQRNDFQDALQIYLNVLKEDSENIHALHLIGLLLKQNGWQEQGDAYLERALTVNPHYAVANHNERVLHNPITGRYSLEESVIEGLREEVIERDKSTVDEWRHRRMLKFAECFDDKDMCSWLTVGDHMGHDAERLSEYGISKVTPSSLSTAYLATAKERGLQADFKSINAEKIELEDGEYDYLLCKEALHHMPRPYLAIYEMLRVAGKAVVFIEPLDPVIDWRPELAPVSISRRFVKDGRFGESLSYASEGGNEIFTRYIDWIEDGPDNYVYTFSQREIKKLAQGYGVPSFAVHTFNDFYSSEYGSSKAIPGIEGFDETVKQIQLHDQVCDATGIPKAYIAAILFKSTPTTQVVTALQNIGFQFTQTLTRFIPFRWPSNY
jgi:ubiquinone/menaquinone biosynthesis C-methylase UbiE